MGDTVSIHTLVLCYTNIHTQLMKKFISTIKVDNLILGISFVLCIVFSVVFSLRKVDKEKTASFRTEFTYLKY